MPLRLSRRETTPASGSTNAQTTAKEPENGGEGAIELATVFEADNVSVELAAPVPGITVAGEKLQLIPLGRPMHARAIALLNAPFSAAILMLYVADAPRFTA